MSEESPERVEEEVKEPVAKKKTARKRSKPPEDHVKEPAESAGDSSGSPKESDGSEPKASSNEEASKPAMKDGETPTENPSVRRISSKRMSSAEKSEGDDSTEPVATIAEPPPAENQGKKRRRRRRKGGANNDDDGGGDEGRQSRNQEKVKLDPDQVTKKAWKIFHSEVSEEGLALVSDQDAKEIGRRSFRLAEIFLEEAARRQ